MSTYTNKYSKIDLIIIVPMQIKLTEILNKFKTNCNVHVYLILNYLILYSEICIRAVIKIIFFNLTILFLNKEKMSFSTVRRYTFQCVLVCCVDFV